MFTTFPCPFTYMELQSSREAFEKVGFFFGEPADNIFLRASLPPGWLRAATDHAIWWLQKEATVWKLARWPQANDPTAHWDDEEPAQMSAQEPAES